jgi:RNA polymerase primary sigma factor
MSVLLNNGKHDYDVNPNILSAYMKEIDRIPLLSREEEVELARRAKGGDEKAKERIVASNLRFVVTVAKNYRNQGLPLMDLISEGNIGLMKAVEKFDVEKGYHFITYAVWWIRQSILKAIAVKSGMIRLPLNRANQLMQLKKLTNEVAGQENRDVDVVEAADRLNIDHTLIRDLMKYRMDFISIDVPLSDESDSPKVSDMIEDDRFRAPDEIAINSSIQLKIREILSTLPDKESQILRCRYGLDGEKPLSLREIGKRLNLTKERIRQIERKTLEKLRRSKNLRQLQEMFV